MKNKIQDKVDRRSSIKVNNINVSVFFIERL